MNYQYFYLVWSLIFLAIWLILFLRRRDLRGEMLFISIIFGIGGLISQVLHIKDWWQPFTLTSTPIGVEDFIIGFSIGGIASALYLELYHFRFKPTHLSPKKERKYYFMGDVFLLTFALVFLGMFYIGDLSSFYSSVLAYILGIFVINFYRKDLITDSFVGGITMLLLGSLIYYFLFLLYPGYIEKFWYLKNNWYSQLILGIPIGEYIWFFLTGAFISPLYEFVRNRRLTPFR